jgi:hypothetical protein
VCSLHKLKFTPTHLAAIKREVTAWQVDLAGELDRIAADALRLLSNNSASRDAEQVLWLVNELRGIDDKQRQRDIMRGYLLGRRVERMNVQPFERITAIGKRKSRKARRQAESTNKKRAAKRPDYKTAVQKLMAQGVKYTPAFEQVAIDFDATPKTVWNNTSELRPRKAKRK